MTGPARRIVQVHKAQPPPDVADLVVEAFTPMPELRVDPSAEGWRTRLDAYRAIFREDARQLARALIETLPGGTLDALLVELLEKKRSSLVVAIDGGGKP